MDCMQQVEESILRLGHGSSKVYYYLLFSACHYYSEKLSPTAYIYYCIKKELTRLIVFAIRLILQFRKQNAIREINDTHSFANRNDAKSII